MKSKAMGTFAAVVVLVAGVALGAFAAGRAGRSAGAVHVTPVTEAQPAPQAAAEQRPVEVGTAVKEVRPAENTSVVEGVKFTRKSAPAVKKVAPAKPAPVATYRLDVGCVGQERHQSGRTTPGGTKYWREDVKPGVRYAYEFSWSKTSTNSGSDGASSAQDPVVGFTKTCTLQTERLTAGSEPPVAVMLACEGHATYDAGSSAQPTSAVSRGWRPSELTTAYEHRMSAPNAGQQSENTTCTVEVVNA